MKVTTFRLEAPKYKSVDEPTSEVYQVIFKVPILPAYSTIDSQLSLEPTMISEGSHISLGHRIQDDCVITGSSKLIPFDNLSGVLTLYHNGIKDYEALFPHIDNPSLKARLGQFASEAENAFNSQSWFSYCMMVGGVLEGLLFTQFGNKKFSDLIDKALKKQLINKPESHLFHEVRKIRNRIHASRHEEPSADRRIALDLSVVYDKLMKRIWDIE